jgi:LuxR family transcriptional regulator, maltose regulon positive regulatory protein
MPITVTRTKIIVPRRRANLLTRKRLNTYLDDLLDHKLLLIAAPAGYGKTSLLVDWVYKNDLPVCWYALDPLDQDITRFISYFIAAISQRFPKYGQQSQAVLQNLPQSKLDIARIVAAIVNDIYENIEEHFVVVLDDFHSVETGEEIISFVNKFVEDVDENCHVIISSRTLISLPNMPLMVGRSMVKGLGYADLAFEAGEIQALLQQNYSQTLSTEIITELEKETEGWITGLLLSAETQWQGMNDRLRVARASGVGLYDYLAQQVLNQQSESIRAFLLQTSLLEEFDATLCQEVFGAAPGEEHWSTLIREVLQNNLFVLRVENQGTWLRYHHLFRDFLQAQIQREDPDQANRILQRLGDVFASRGQWEKAYDIFQRIENRAGIMSLLEQAGSPMLKNGRLQVLTRWLAALSTGELTTHPVLLALQGTIEFSLGNVEQGVEKLNQAEGLMIDTTSPQKIALLYVRRATGLRFLGQYENALKDVDKALTITNLNGDFPEIRAEAFRIKGLCLYSLGALENALQFIKKGLDAYALIGDEQNKNLLHLDLGLVFMGAGRFSEAQTQFEIARRYWEQTSNLIRLSNVLNNLGVLYHLIGEYDQAGLTLVEALTSARKSGNVRIEAYSLASLGDIYTDLEYYEASSDAFQQAFEISNRIEHQFLLFYIKLADARISYKTLDLDQALIYLEAAHELIQSDKSIFEQGLYQLRLGEIRIAQGNPTAAISILKIALQHFRAGGQKAEEIHTRFALAQAYCEAGDTAATIDQLNQVIRPVVNTERWHILVIASKERKSLLKFIVEPQETTLTLHIIWLRKKIIEFERKIPDFRRKLRKTGQSVLIEQTPKLAIITLGTAHVLQDGAEISSPEWTNQKAVRELFYLLLEHPEGLSKEDIGLVLWPDSTPQRLKTQFKNALYRLRRALGKEVVLFAENEDIYRFNRFLDYDYDVEIFRDQIRASGNLNNQAQIEALQMAVDLYQGDYLPEIGGVWVVPKREQLWQEYLRSHLKLAQHAFSNRDYLGVVDYVQDILGLDACQEEAHRLAMQAYAARGNRANLVRQFDLCKEALINELGVRPSPQTELLFQALLAQQEV